MTYSAFCVDGPVHLSISSLNLTTLLFPLLQGFPTIKFFGSDKNKPIDYSGARDASSIVTWAMNQAQKVVKNRLSGGKDSSSSGSERPKEKPKRDSEPGGGKHVVTLTPDNFDALVFGSSEPWMIEFYAPVSIS